MDSPAPVPVVAPGATLWWRRWWLRQSPARQDRIALLAPLAAVLLFMAAIISAFWYLRLEEIGREQETVKRDMEYAQQRLRLRLIEQQEQFMRLARDVSNRDVNSAEFVEQAEAMVARYPELMAISWIDPQRRIKVNYTSANVLASQLRSADEVLKPGETGGAFDLTRDLRQPVYARPSAANNTMPLLQLHVPLSDQGRFNGVILGEYAIDGLMRFGIPAETTAKYAVALLDDQANVLAGSNTPARPAASRLLPWYDPGTEYEVPVTPVGNSLVLRGQAYRTSLGVIGSGLFWLVIALSLLTAWMLIGNWKHTRRRIQAQNALIEETNFRRAMENSMLTGMRVLDLQGRITYVNPAFCQMTGWSEAELVNRDPPFAYWPEEDHALLNARLTDEINGRTPPGGFQVRVKRKEGSIFDARLYVSPLIDAHGQQTGWMASMTDITEPNRVREQLSASYERFTTVLEALDAAVSVAPLGSEEILFANRLYRLWFGSNADGHLGLVAQAGVLESLPHDEVLDDVDSFAGLPTDPLTAAQTENAEIFIPELNKWLEVRSRYLNWVDGRLAQMVIATDITPRRHAEEQAATQAERAHTASRLITMGEMASSVAHELNQPLTAINNYCNGMVSRIRSQQISNEDLLTALEKTARQAQRAGQIIQRIRSFVKRSEPNRSIADIAVIVNEAVELAEIELRRRHVRLSHYVAARLPKITVDPILIEQVLINLLKNAAEAIDHAQRPSSRRNVELRVVPRRTEAGDMVEFAVTDNGDGLVPEVKERLFEAFYSTKSDGMGIGLSLCRSIVESHQGRMQADNLYNGSEIVGCRFTFWLPVTAASSPKARHGVAATE
ncbi:MAG TPA: PAS domain-containing sensor histidine kinase [Burkholderiaceae bacterium]